MAAINRSSVSSSNMIIAKTAYPRPCRHDLQLRRPGLSSRVNTRMIIPSLTAWCHEEPRRRSAV
jgi:hypothetical protein